MRHGMKYILAGGLATMVPRAVAQVASVCPSTDVCFKLNIPDKTASSGKGDIFFQLSAPSSYEYVALGQGDSMSGSNMFIVYTSGDGNVTLSPRLGTGERMPLFNSDAQVTLLEGSGVSNGKMIANVRCSSCNSWSGGSASFSGGDGQWIYAVHQKGGPKDKSSKQENIDQHDQHASFQWSYANAKGGNSVNPLVAAAGSGPKASNGGSSTAPTSCIPRSAGAAATGSGSVTAVTSAAASEASSKAKPTKTDDDDDDDSRDHRGRPTDFPSYGDARPTGGYDSRAVVEDISKRQELNYCDENGSSTTGFTPIKSGGGTSSTKKMLIAHGTLAALAFVIFFPFGAIAIRLASFTGVVWFHAAFQVFAYVVYTVAFALGIRVACNYDLLSDKHPIIGIVVFVVLFFQPIFGFLHHFLYKKYQSRTLWSYVHLWLGRLAITLGIINGGLGFQLADRMKMSSRPGMIAYSVVAGVVWLAWVASIFIGERRRRTAVANARPKYTDSPREVSESQPVNEHYAPK